MDKTRKRQVGDIGEGIACKFLMKRGFRIINRNYLKKWGELDIVAERGKILHFIEVKTVSHETDHLPEENVHLWKRKRLARVIQTYLLDKKVSDETEWQIDIMAIFLDFASRKAKIRVTSNVILS
ncbi:MAG TPA: YraN family protein [Candidatus Paceibacterota bacterium]